jgi:lysophospholipase L1-like esterase
LFLHYLALGDSMSIDLYPALDAGEADVAVALERDAHAGRVAPLGAASLLHANDEERWPDEIGLDLRSRYPGIEYTNLAADGATIGDVWEQLAELEPSDEPTLVTLTVGAVDVLSTAANHPRKSLRAGIARDLVEAYRVLVERIVEARPSAHLLVTTVYDPSDRTGQVAGALRPGDKLPLALLDAYNGALRELAAEWPDATLADVYLHFLGHGTTAPEEDRWYWRRSPLEPNARGASEIRRVWLEALDALEGGR